MEHIPLRAGNIIYVHLIIPHRLRASYSACPNFILAHLYYCMHGQEVHLVAETSLG